MHRVIGYVAFDISCRSSVMLHCAASSRSSIMLHCAVSSMASTIPHWAVNTMSSAMLHCCQQYIISHAALYDQQHVPQPPDTRPRWRQWRRLLTARGYPPLEPRCRRGLPTRPAPPEEASRTAFRRTVPGLKMISKNILTINAKYTHMICFINKQRQILRHFKIRIRCTALGWMQSCSLACRGLDAWDSRK